MSALAVSYCFSASFAAGLLAHALEEEINIVNAEVLLRERGVELVEERRSEIGAFSSVVQIEVESEKAVVMLDGADKSSRWLIPI